MNPELASLYMKGLEDRGALDREDRLRFDFMLLEAGVSKASSMNTCTVT